MTINLNQLLDNWDLFFDEAFNGLRYTQQRPAFPPANLIEDKNGEYIVIEMAVAGFAKENLEISIEDSKIIIKGNKDDKLPDNETYTKKTLNTNSFERSYSLKTNHFSLDKIQTSLKDGILSIRLNRNPESAKKTIAIQ